MCEDLDEFLFVSSSNTRPAPRRYAEVTQWCSLKMTQAVSGIERRTRRWVSIIIHAAGVIRVGDEESSRCAGRCMRRSLSGGR